MLERAANAATLSRFQEQSNREARQEIERRDAVFLPPSQEGAPAKAYPGRHRERDINSRVQE